MRRLDTGNRCQRAGMTANPFLKPRCSGKLVAPVTLPGRTVPIINGITVGTGRTLHQRGLALRAFACPLIFVAIALSVLSSASAKTVDSPTGQITTPTGFLDMLKQIAACDLREIDHVAQIVGAKATIIPSMIERDGHQILGWVDIDLQPAPDALRPPFFIYSIAIEGALSRISYEPMRKTISVMSFRSLPGCISDDVLNAQFRQPINRLLGTDGGGAYEAVYKVGVSDDYTTELRASFAGKAACADVLSIAQMSAKDQNSH